MQNDIEKNLKVREGALRILAMAGNTIQRLDAAKTILVSNARLVVAMKQLQREKTNEANAAAVADKVDQSQSAVLMSGKRFCSGMATLCLSGTVEIRAYHFVFNEIILTPLQIIHRFFSICTIKITHSIILKRSFCYVHFT